MFRSEVNQLWMHVIGYYNLWQIEMPIKDHSTEKTLYRQSGDNVEVVLLWTFKETPNIVRFSAIYQLHDCGL